VTAPNSSSREWQIIREAENIIALAVDMNEDLEVIIEFLRRHAGPEWTELALERALNARLTGVKIKKRLAQFHPHKEVPADADGG
jgi:hypothetical protein